MIRRVALVLAFAACVQATAPTGDGTADDGVVRDYAALLSRLRSSDLRIEEAGSIEQPFFSVPGRVLRLNGDDVQVFEYPSSDAMQRDAAKVDPSGGSVGTTMVSWMAPPHFFRRGRLLVIHLGDQRQVHDLLQGLLGAQFAGR